jgi:arabinogalactan endo-1,4-beta-galactosidase
MKMSEEFPSKFLKAADLQGREVRVIMQNVEREKIGDDTKPVLYFKGKDKGIVLNKTNAGTISDSYGDDTEDWFDQPLILFSVMVDFQGKVAPAIRVRVPTAKDNRQAPQRQADPISSGLAPPMKTDMDDPIPFAAEFR